MVILGKPHSAWVVRGEAFSSFVDTLSCKQLAVRGTCCQPPVFLWPHAPGTAGRPHSRCLSCCCDPVPCSLSLQTKAGKQQTHICLGSKWGIKFFLSLQLCTQRAERPPVTPAGPVPGQTAETVSQTGLRGSRHRCSQTWPGCQGGGGGTSTRTHLQTQLSYFALRGHTDSTCLKLTWMRVLEGPTWMQQLVWL